MMSAFEAIDRLAKLPVFVWGYHGTDDDPIGGKKLLHIPTGILLQVIELNNNELVLCLRNITLGKTTEAFDMFCLRGSAIEKYVLGSEGFVESSVFA